MRIFSENSEIPKDFIFIDEKTCSPEDMLHVMLLYAERSPYLGIMEIGGIKCFSVNADI
jgi:hypothetical protein